MERNQRGRPLFAPTAQKPRTPWGTKTGRRAREDEKKIVEKVEEVIPESKIFTALLDFERKLDATLSRRKLDVQEALRVRPVKSTATLRLTVSNTYNNQEAVYNLDSSYSASLRDVPLWTLKIEGKVLDNLNLSSMNVRIPATTKKFSSFFSKIFIQLDKDLFPNNDIIEWHQAAQKMECDGFEIKRPGNQETTAKIILHLEHNPPQYKVSADLGRILGGMSRAETRARILVNIWQYIKANKLQDLEDRKTIINNAALKELFGCERMQFSQIPQLITEHLSPPDPYEIDFKIRLSGNPQEWERVFDIQVQMEDTSAISQNFDASMKEIEQCDDQISKSISQLNKLKRKRDFMLNFAKSPVEFIHSFAESQLRDYKIIGSETGGLDEEERYAEFYYQPFVQEAIGQFVQSSVTPHER